MRASRLPPDRTASDALRAFGATGVSLIGEIPTARAERLPRGPHDAWIL